MRFFLPFASPPASFTAHLAIFSASAHFFLPFASPPASLAAQPAIFSLSFAFFLACTRHESTSFCFRTLTFKSFLLMFDSAIRREQNFHSSRQAGGCRDSQTPQIGVFQERLGLPTKSTFHQSMLGSTPQTRVCRGARLAKPDLSRSFLYFPTPAFNFFHLSGVQACFRLPPPSGIFAFRGYKLVHCLPPPSGFFASRGY